MSRAWGDDGKGQGPEVQRSDLIVHLRSGFKTPDHWLLGLEQEKLGTVANGAALPFYGPGGVEEVLGVLEQRPDMEARREDDHIVGLEGVDGAGVTLEPGGQIEFVSAPRTSLRELEHDLCTDLKRVLEAGGEDRHWLALGLQPVTPQADMEWISRERYRIMAKHLRARGDLAHLMMTQTAGVQLNVDFQDEEDARRKMRAAMGVTSLVTAAFANSPFYEGKPNGWASYRSHIWTRTDPTRCGLIRAAVEGDGMGLEDWVDYALGVPAMFIIRDGGYRPLEGLTFGEYLEQGFEGYRADQMDWEIHLTTLFPEVRFKTYMEVRGIDGVARPLAMAGVALWKGILYSHSACEAAWDLVSDFSWDERLQLHEEAARRGTRGEFRGRPLSDWIDEVVEIASNGLADETRAIPAENEDAYLDPLREQLSERGGSPAFELLDLWEGEWAGDPAKLVEAVALTPCQVVEE